MSPEKVDVLDLIIAVLMEHERRMDELVTRLEYITPSLEKEMNR